MKRSVHCTATVYQTTLALLLRWEGAALTVPNTSGIIKAESAPMFFGMYYADFKWTFYIYRLNRRCVLLGQPYYAVAKQPKSRVHMAHMQYPSRAPALDPGVKVPVQAPGTQQCPQKLAEAQWDMPAPHTVPSGNAP